MRLKTAIFLLSLLFLSPLIALDDMNPVEIRLIAEHEQVTPGQDVSLLIDIKLAPKWHLYWKNPGEVGFAPTFEWKLPEGVSLVKMDWATPEHFEEGGLITFGYKDTASFLVTLHLTQEFKETNLPIKTEISWLACSDETCLPGSGPVELEIMVGDSAIPHAKHSPLFKLARGILPQKLTASQYSSEKNQVFLDLNEGEIAFNDENSFFFPNEGVIAQSIRIEKNLNGLQRLSLGTLDSPLKGVLVVGSKAYEIETPQDAKTEADRVTLVWALIFAFAGGLLLNLMPCVLPVVSLKVMSFVQMAGNSRGALFKQGLYFTCGVLVSFWSLAGILILLQLSGESVGWGFQLQEPFFIACLALLFGLLGLSLFGVFELGTSMASWAGTQSSGQGKNSSSFLNGMFATIVATPCTGPFMGTALGYALTQSAFISFAIFTALGVGMSLPYLLLGAFPALLRWMPKPGAWMESFKQFLGFLMWATVIWLLWVFAGQTSFNALFILIGALLLLSVGAWIYGRWGAPHRAKRIRRVSYLLTILCLALTLTGASYASKQVDDMQQVVENDWEPFSLARLDELRLKNTPVFIDFTAKWCLICQANHLILSQNKVEEKLKEKGVVKMKADWTKKNGEITAMLNRHGRSGVPLYLYFSGPIKNEPLILPQVLTPEIVINALENTTISYVR